MQGHALTAVEAFSTGRFQPLQENPKIWALRMSDRRIGSALETGYSTRTGQKGFSPWFVGKLWISLFCEIFGQYFEYYLCKPFRSLMRTILGERLYSELRAAYHDYFGVYRIEYSMLAEYPVLLCAYKGFNLVKVSNTFYAVRQGLSLDLTIDEGRGHPEALVSTDYNLLLKLVQKASKQ